MSHRNPSTAQNAPLTLSPLGLVSPKGGDSFEARDSPHAALKRSICGGGIGKCVSEGGIGVEVYDIFKTLFLAGLILATAYGVYREIGWVRRVINDRR